VLKSENLKQVFWSVSKVQTFVFIITAAIEYCVGISILFAFNKIVSI
jgi:hypothetical protein